MNEEEIVQPGEVLIQVQAKCFLGNNDAVSLFIEPPVNDQMTIRPLETQMGYLPGVCPGCLAHNAVERRKESELLKTAGNLMPLHVTYRTDVMLAGTTLCWVFDCDTDRS